MIIVAKITVEKIEGSKTPKFTPNIPIIKENSESCAKEIEVRKLVFALYPVVLSRKKVINGFNKKAPINSADSKIILCPIPSNTICIPKDTKKSIAKKSLSGKILDPNSDLNGELAKETPAINAPIIIERPAEYAKTMNRNSTASER